MRRSTRALLFFIGIVSTMFALGACSPNPGVTPTPTRTPVGPGVVLGGPGQATQTLPPTQAMQLGPFGPDSYPPDVNPLTGLPVSDPAVLNRRPLAVKVSNDVRARPQSGLSFADLVYEHYTEGGVTRLTAIYYSQSAERVGSLRSGRLIDLEIVPMYDAIYTSSGFSTGVMDRMSQASWVARNFASSFGYGEPYLVRIEMENVSYEHTLFAIPDRLWELATQKVLNQPPDLTPGMAFYSVPPAGGKPITQITIHYDYDAFKVEWRYDPTTGKYLRLQAGQPHLDALTGQQLSADNVILVSAMHVQTDILEDTYGTDHYSAEIQIWGEGTLTLFRDGQRYEGQWHRQNPEEMLAFTDLSGNVLYLKPGQTWIEMIPIGFDGLIALP